MQRPLAPHAPAPVTTLGRSRGTLVVFLCAGVLALLVAVFASLSTDDVPDFDSTYSPIVESNTNDLHSLAQRKRHGLGELGAQKPAPIVGSSVEDRPADVVSKEKEKAPKVGGAAKTVVSSEHCKHGRVNFILYDYDWPAGLNHQLNVSSEFIAMSEALCATMLLPKPCHMLHWKAHNHNKALKCDYYWDRYWNLTSYLIPFVNILNDPDDYENVTKGLPVLHLEKDAPANTIAHHSSQLEKYYHEQKPFVWRVSDTFHGPVMMHIRKKFMACGAKSHFFGSSRHTLDLAANFSKHLKMENGTNWTSLHIRRNDAKKSCDTTVENVVGFVRCSNKKERISTLTIFTDEKDPVYLKSLKTRLLAIVSRVVYADHAIHKLVETGVATNPLEKAVVDDNFLLFGVGKELQGFASRMLKLNRFYCDLNCTGIKKPKPKNTHIDKAGLLRNDTAITCNFDIEH